jgi:hypothetical protein
MKRESNPVIMVGLLVWFFGAIGAALLVFAVIRMGGGR